MTNDNVNHPSHYQSDNGLEVIDVITAFTSDLTGVEAVDTGNIIKYICRWKKKNGIEDLKKAAWYLDHLIAHVSKKARQTPVIEKQTVGDAMREFLSDVCEDADTPQILKNVAKKATADDYPEMYAAGNTGDE